MSTPTRRRIAQRIADHLFDDGSNKANVICSRAAVWVFLVAAVVIGAAFTLGGL